MEKIPCKIVRSSRRTVALVIKEDGSLEVRAPHFAPEASIQKFISEKRSWIKKKVEEIRQRPPKPKRLYIEGDKFLYLGKKYILSYSPKVKKISVKAENLVVPAAFSNDCAAHLEKWFRREARRIISERVESLALRYGFIYSTIRIGAAKRRWGSCTSKGVLSFCYRLVMAPEFIVDCVVAHELCHTKVLNHSKKFYALLLAVIPQYKKGHEWLKKNGHVLVV